jgi:Ser/Thr protein kinase RdoA (MazF antagonist)
MSRPGMPAQEGGQTQAARGHDGADGCDAAVVGPDQATLTALRSCWGLRKLAVVSRHQTSRDRTVWRMATEFGEFAVKVDLRPHASVVGGTAVQAHVAARRPGLAPRPVPTVDGRLAVTADDRRTTVSAWASGRFLVDEPQVWCRIGETAAVLHGLPAVRRPFAVPIDLVAEELAGHPTLPQDLIGEIVDRLGRVGEEPTSLVHGQLNLANVIERAGGRLTVLDWDEAGTGSSAIDLAYPLICEFLTEDLTWHNQQAGAFFRRYRETATTPLPDPDAVMAIGLILALRSAVFSHQTLRVERVRHAIAHEATIRRSIDW